MENKTNKFALISLILGIVSVICSFTVVLGIVCGIIAIVFGVKGKKDISETNQSNKGLGIGGIITGAIGAAFSLVFLFIILIAIFSPFMQTRTEKFRTNFEKIIQENFDSDFSWDKSNDIVDNGEKVEIKIPTTVGKNNKTKELYDKGYENNMHSISDNVYKTLFVKDNSYIVATAKLNDEQYEIYQNISMYDDDYNGEIKAFIISLDDVSLKDVSDKVPNQKDLDKYVGCTLGDLEKAGYEKTGTTVDDDGLVFLYSNGTYDIEVSLDNSIVVDDLDDLSENDIRAFKIDKITFTGLGFGILEEE